MLLTLLLSGYIPPSDEFFYFLFFLLGLFVVLGLWLLVLGVRQIRRDSTQMRGYWFIVGALAVPLLGYCWLMSLF
jgi:hypothetical protein